MPCWPELTTKSSMDALEAEREVRSPECARARDDLGDRRADRVDLGPSAVADRGLLELLSALSRVQCARGLSKALENLTPLSASEPSADVDLAM